MCFSNFHNHFGSMQVFLSFGVYYDNVRDSAHLKEEEQKKKEEVSTELNNTLSIIEVSGVHAVSWRVEIVQLDGVDEGRRGLLSCRAPPTEWKFTSSTCSATTASDA